MSARFARIEHDALLAMLGRARQQGFPLALRPKKIELGHISLGKSPCAATGHLRSRSARRGDLILSASQVCHDAGEENENSNCPNC